MAKERVDSSGISFTALYTGQVWSANGLSDPRFSTLPGQLLYGMLAPFEHLGGWLAGGNLRTFLLQRHYLIDHLVHQAIQYGAVSQILEIACGLSPRGLRFTRAYPQLTYLETDLPAMAARKRLLLRETATDLRRHRVLACDIFRESGDSSLTDLLSRETDRRQPLLIITEGLVNYFDLDSVSGFWSRLRNELAAFPAGIYLTDNYPLAPGQPFARTLRLLARGLGVVSRSKVSFHFSNDEEAVKHFARLGFDSVQCHNPDDFRHQLELPAVRRPSLVRVIEARTHGGRPARPA